MNAPAAGARRSVFVALVALALVLMFPIDATLAYSHDTRDDLGQLNYSYFKTTNVGSSWISQSNSYNGYDDDTAIDCLEEYPNCQNPGTGDTARWFPYPSPSPYWMCPYSHVANDPTWSGSLATYITEANGAKASSLMFQPNYLNAWYQMPNGKFYSDDYAEVEGYGGGNGAISADATDFHYNPNNPNDSGCS